MALAATFYRNGKDRNSTALPPTIPELKREYTIEIKAPSNIVSPIIAIKPDNIIDEPFNYNYCYIGSFYRFYWVSGWTWNNGIWTAQLNEDVLTTYRDAIGNSTQYVARSSYARNGSVVDAMYPALATNTINYMDIPWGWEALSGGFYIVGIINGAENNLGTMAYYAMSHAALYAFSAFLINDFSEWFSQGVSELSENVQKALVNPTDYISMVKWVPLKLSDMISGGFVTAVTSLKFGYWEIPRQVSEVYKFNTLSIEKNVNGVTIKKHPQAARGQYLNAGPYTAYILHLPPFGDIPLDSSMMIGASQLNFRLDFDVTTTSGVLTVYSNRGRVETSEIMKARTVIGVDIRLDKLGYDVSNQNFGFYALGSIGLSLVDSYISSEAQKAGGTHTATTGALHGGGGQHWDDEPRAAQSNGTLNRVGTAALAGVLGPLAGAAFAIAEPQIIDMFQSTASRLYDTREYQTAITEGKNIVSSLGTSLINLHSAGAIGSFAEYIRPSAYVQCVFADIAPESLERLGAPLCEMRQINTIPGYIQVSNPHMNGIGSAFPDEVAIICNYMEGGFYYS